MTEAWSHFEHGADVGVRGVGDTPAQAFAQAALALTGIVTPPERVAPRECIEVECEAPDLEVLLVDWLNAVIAEMATREMLFARFDVTISGHFLRARICGEAVDRVRHCPTVEVKGATFTALTVRHEAQGWLAQCVVDV